MNDPGIISDLKQFIVAAVKQEGSSIRDDMNALEKRLTLKIDNVDVKLTSKIDGVDSKLETIIEAVGDKFEDHEQRITKLESQPA